MGLWKHLEEARGTRESWRERTARVYNRFALICKQPCGDVWLWVPFAWSWILLEWDIRTYSSCAIESYIILVRPFVVKCIKAGCTPKAVVRRSPSGILRKQPLSIPQSFGKRRRRTGVGPRPCHLHGHTQRTAASVTIYFRWRPLSPNTASCSLATVSAAGATWRQALALMTVEHNMDMEVPLCGRR